MNLKDLFRFLGKHKRSCSFWIFSGDRHCSCGRDKALLQLRALLDKLDQAPELIQLSLLSEVNS